MGGVKTDLWGATSGARPLRRWRSSLHGRARREPPGKQLLLEGLVYGERAGLGAARYAAKQASPGAPPKRLLKELERKPTGVFTASDVEHIRTSLRKIMWENVGIVRTKKGLTRALKKLREWDRMVRNPPRDRDALELRNMITASSLITCSALLRQGSVGAHYRSDLPAKGKNWRKRTVMKK